MLAHRFQGVILHLIVLLSRHRHESAVALQNLVLTGDCGDHTGCAERLHSAALQRMSTDRMRST
jgi:hypothetical protein